MITKDRLTLPQIEGHNENDNTSATPRQNPKEPAEFNGISMPEGWLENMAHQTTQPLWESDEIQRAIKECVAECVAAHKAQKKQSFYALSSGAFEWDWRLGWLLFWLLLVATAGLAAA